jgi:ribosomal protein S18 acetylase RimI-like enzyme
MKIHRAKLVNLPKIALLFDQYRQFYEQPSDINRALDFLKKRLKKGESVLFFAEIDEKTVGFVQLYPVFSSVTTERSWLLNDLFVVENFRKNGVGEALLEAAKNFVTKKKHKGLLLETAESNVVAQRLYERLGWELESADYRFYFWKSS